MGNALLALLFGLGLVCSLLCGFGKRSGWFPLSALCTVCGILTGLTKGYSTETLLLPVLLGIGLHYLWPKAADKTDRVLSKLAFPLLLVLITVFYIQHHRTILENIGLLGLCVTALILVAIGLSSLLSRLVKNSPQQRRTVIIEVGMQNAAQAIAIASSPLIFANEEMAIPAILYSLMMNIVLLTYVGLVRKKGVK